jgi:hypothetical protein
VTGAVLPLLTLPAGYVTPTGTSEHFPIGLQLEVPDFVPPPETPLNVSAIAGDDNNKIAIAIFFIVSPKIWRETNTSTPLQHIYPRWYYAQMRKRAKRAHFRTLSLSLSASTNPYLLVFLTPFLKSVDLPLLIAAVGWRRKD